VTDVWSSPPHVYAHILYEDDDEEDLDIPVLKKLLIDDDASGQKRKARDSQVRGALGVRVSKPPPLMVWPCAFCSTTTTQRERQPKKTPKTKPQAQPEVVDLLSSDEGEHDQDGTGSDKRGKSEGRHERQKPSWSSRHEEPRGRVGRPGTEDGEGEGAAMEVVVEDEEEEDDEEDDYSKGIKRLIATRWVRSSRSGYTH
jgi:hypothetical protein